MMNKMWFGTRGYETWVPHPAINYDAPRVGWSSKLQYLNGGADVKQSTSGHKELALTWNLISRESARGITDFAEGVYGNGLVNWVDPFTVDTNLVPQYWAAPAIMAKDGPLLTNKTTRPTTVQTDFNTLRYPAESAVLTPVTAPTPMELYIPIPPDYTAWFGAHGTGAAVFEVAASTGPTSTGTGVKPALLPVTSDTRFNHSVSSVEGSGMVVRMVTSGTATVAGVMIQLHPTGATPPTGGFISGQGHSGFKFDGQPRLTQYSAALDRVGVVAPLVEVGAWQHVPVS